MSLQEFKIITGNKLLVNIFKVLYIHIKNEKNWQERRDALETLDKLTNVKKITPGDFSEVVKSLLHVMLIYFN